MTVHTHRRHFPLLSVTAVAFFLLMRPIDQERACGDEPTPQWVWADRKRAAGQSVSLRRRFTIDRRLKRAVLRGTFESCNAAFFINGESVARRNAFGPAVRADVTRLLQQGEHVLGVTGQSLEGPAAIALRLDLEFVDGQTQTIVTDSGWQAASFDESALRPPRQVADPGQGAIAFGPVGRAAWGNTGDGVSIDPVDDYTQWKRALGPGATTEPARIQAPAGFEVELLRSARDGEGSWIALAFDRQGRLVISREEHGLLRLTLPDEEADSVRVESVNQDLHECRGLLFAHDALYAMANEDRGLYRLRDTTGDDRFDEVELLRRFAGGPGHGRNQLTLGPDGGIYGIFGDAVVEPEDLRRRVPGLARPDRYEQAQSGFLARTGPEGRQWEILARGLRNPFGIAFNPEGEPFTYDADAEHDMGAPWYRPTRIVHLVSGGDYGWRRVTKEWPPYDPDRPDMPPPVLDIGKGSPTAVAFGTDSRFPPPYRQALFVLDWAYGRVLAVHLAPRGSGYRGQAEVFLQGRPLNVTDAAFGPDGALYFVTGGRGTHSALYRVRYAGPERKQASPTDQQTARRRHAERARKLRRKLEAFHGRRDARAVDTAWPHLGSRDPWIRHAARVALEWQPPEQWTQQALRESDPPTALTALLALSRVGPPDVVSRVVERLNEIDWKSLTRRQRLATIFIYRRCLRDEEVLSEAERQKIQQKLEAVYPARFSRVNRKLSRLLADFEPDGFVDRTVNLLGKARSQEDRLHYLFVLRNVKSGWSQRTRRMYFEHLAGMESFSGGRGMPTFRRLIRTAALKHVPAENRGHYEALLERNETQDWLAAVPDEERSFVRNWSVEDLAGELDELDRERDLESGRRIFAAARCIICHRIEGRGGVLGPDLTSVARRFSPRDMLTALLEPSRVVAEKYRGHVFVLEDGRVITGQIVPGGDYRSPELTVMTDPLAPESVVTFAKRDVVRRKPSTVSPMPKGLLDTFTKGEILDLLAYLESGGN